MHKFKLLLITIVVVAYANGQTLNTPKTESSVYELPDYIVTGTLWDTPIQNVSESVTLFSETAIKDRQAIHFQDLVNAIPNLTVTGGNNRSRYFQLRGLGENSQFEGETPDLS
ncbi:MAG: TonB-dependent receptor plug domain-containing protein, partial [Opitutales bacterium]